MVTMEIDNFVRKFKQLCFAGISATLNVESKNGKAIVNLTAEIDIKAPIDDKPVITEKFRSTAYNRRKARRRESRNVESVEHSEAEEALNDGEENIKDSNSVKPQENDVALHVPDSEANVLSERIDSVQEVEKSGTVTNGDPSKVGDVIGIDSGTHSDIVSIHATASLVNSPCNKVDTACQHSVFALMDSKDHLKRNIVKGKAEHIRSRPDDNCNGKFKHEIDMVIEVRTNSLWEPARTYIWKHLGNSSWTFNDGTEVSFIKIHRK